MLGSCQRFPSFNFLSKLRKSHTRRVCLEVRLECSCRANRKHCSPFGRPPAGGHLQLFSNLIACAHYTCCLSGKSQNIAHRLSGYPQAAAHCSVLPCLEVSNITRRSMLACYAQVSHPTRLLGSLLGAFVHAAAIAHRLGCRLQAAACRSSAILLHAPSTRAVLGKSQNIAHRLSGRPQAAARCSILPCLEEVANINRRSSFYCYT